MVVTPVNASTSNVITNTRSTQCQPNTLLKELAPFHPVIVSGLAYGVDAVAHKAALKEGMDTVALV